LESKGGEKGESSTRYLLPLASTLTAPRGKDWSARDCLNFVLQQELTSMPALKNHQPPHTPTATAPMSNGAPAIPWAAPAPHGRPSWSGLLRLSLVSVPVKAYAAVQSSSPSAFHLLHAHCGQRIRYAKHCPQHGVVDIDALVRGYEYATDQYVVV